MSHLFPAEFQTYAGDKPSPTDGDIWYNSGTGKLRKREAGVTTDLSSGGAGIAADTFWAAKGDLAVATANDAASVLPVGTNGQVLTADSTQATGTKWSTVAGTGDALVANPLSQFAATTSAQLAGVITDETGTGVLVLATSPTLVTPVLGAASATSLTLTNDLAIADGGTGQSTAVAAFDALSPTTTKGDLIVMGDAADNIRVPVGTNTHVLTADSTVAAGIKWAVVGPTLVTGGTGDANQGAAPSETWHTLSANASANATATIVAVMTTTNVPAGTYLYRYDIIAQSTSATVSLKFSVDATGTVTKTVYHLFFPSQGVVAATGIVDQELNATTGAVWAHESTRIDNTTLGPTTDVDTINANLHYVIEGMLVTSTNGSLVLGHASESATSTQVMSGTTLVLRRVA